MTTSRLEKIFGAAKVVSGNRAFDYYYGSVLHDHPESGISADEARRDFNKVRQTIFWVRTYS